MSKVRTHLVKALAKKYEAEIAEAKATIEIYLDNSVGIGEHPQHIEEIDKLLTKISNAQENLDTIGNILIMMIYHFNRRIDGKERRANTTKNYP